MLDDCGRPLGKGSRPLCRGGGSRGRLPCRSAPASALPSITSLRTDHSKTGLGILHSTTQPREAEATTVTPERLAAGASCPPKRRPSLLIHKCFRALGLLPCYAPGQHSHKRERVRICIYESVRKSARVWNSYISLYLSSAAREGKKRAHTHPNHAGRRSHWGESRWQPYR